MVAVQVERDPKTGATVVRSVAPVSTPTGAPHATTVFDDGRMTIHAVGESGSQPSTQELEQILSVINGVGMKVMLDEVTVTHNQTENIETRRRTPEEKCLSPSRGTSKEENPQRDSTRSYELETENCVGNLQNRSTAVVRDTPGEVGNVEDQRLEDVPVTLRFLGYTDATTGQGHSQEDQEVRLSVERVLITEDGEEHVLGSRACSEKAVDQDAEKEFQDISLDGKEAGARVQGEEGDDGLQKPPAASTAGGGTSKHKSCQCCSVM